MCLLGLETLCARLHCPFDSKIFPNLSEMLIPCCKDIGERKICMLRFILAPDACGNCALVLFLPITTSARVFRSSLFTLSSTLPWLFFSMRSTAAFFKSLKLIVESTAIYCSKTVLKVALLLARMPFELHQAMYPSS